MENNLAHIPMGNLLKEIDRREIIEKNKEIERRRDLLKLVVTNREVLKLFMDHSRNSCKDHGNFYYHPEHGGADCDLCCLEKLTIDDTDVNISIDIKLSKG